MPSFSVVIPFRNAAATLPDTLASLQAQTHRDWTALLVDDASTDGSVALVRAASAADPRLRLLHDPAQATARGAAATRNVALANATGDFVAFLDADDLWAPDKLTCQAAAFADGADIVFAGYRRVTADGGVLGVVHARPRVRWRDALGGNPIGCLTAAYRRARFAGARMPLRPVHEDYAFWLSLLRTGTEARGLPRVLADYRVTQGSLSARKLRGAAEVWAILGAEGLALPRRAIGFGQYAARGVARRLG